MNKSFFVLRFLCKILVIFIIAGAVTQVLQSQEYYAYSPNGRINFSVVNSRALIKFTAGLSVEEQERILAEQQIFESIRSSGVTTMVDAKLVRIKASVTTPVLISTLGRLQLQTRSIEYATPILTNGNDTTTLIGLSQRIVVRRKPTTTLNEMNQVMARMGIIFEKDYPFDEERLTHYLLNTSNTGKASIEIAATLYEGGLFDFSEPDYTVMKIGGGNGDGSPNKPFPDNKWDGLMVIGDDYYPLQWALNGKSSTTFGGDSPGMGVDKAWAITKGSPDIKIAVFDTGVDLNHEDLKKNLLPGKDYTGKGTPLGGCDINSDNPNEAHGTLCSGIIAADNNSIGIRGVAPNCKIIPVKVATSLGDGTFEFISSSKMAEAIEWAYKEADASIYSMSFRVSYDIAPAVSFNALKKAMTSGRGGKGCLVVAAAGNHIGGDGKNNINPWPAKQPGVLAIGATTPCDQRKTLASPNDSKCNKINFEKMVHQDEDQYYAKNPDGTIGELYKIDPSLTFIELIGLYASDFSSSYGNELFACAPGNFIISTDIMGKKGINFGKLSSWTNTTPIKSEPFSFGNEYVITVKLPRPLEILDPAGNYSYFGGTSAAAPHAAGVIALMLSANPSLSAAVVKFILGGNCDKVGGEIYSGPGVTRSEKMGYGRINAYNAVSSATATSGQTAFSQQHNDEERLQVLTSIANNSHLQDNLHVFPNPSNGEVRIAFPVSFVGNVRVRVISALGMTVMENTDQIGIGQTINLNLTNLNPGAYIVEAFVNEKKYQRSVIIHH